jgi:transposase
MEQVPDPEVPERPRPPRTYPAAYKLRILGEDEQLDKAGQGALLRREGLYTSLISEWRKQRDKGALAAFTAPRGRPPVDPLQRENARLQRENATLRDQLERALVGGADASRPERAFRAASVAEPRRHVWLCDVDCGHEFWTTAGRLVSTSAENLDTSRRSKTGHLPHRVGFWTDAPVGCRREEEGVYQVQDWAEVHRLLEREGLSKSAIAKRLGMSRPTVIRLLGL